MKKQYIFIATLFIVATAFTVIQPLTTHNQIRTKILQQALITEMRNEDYDATYFPDTTIRFSNPETNEIEPHSKYFLHSYIGMGIPSTWIVWDAIDKDN